MRTQFIIFSVLVAILIPYISFAKSLGKCLGTFEIGTRHPVEINRANFCAAYQKALAEGQRKSMRIAAVVDQTFSDARLTSTGWRVLSRTGDVVTLEGLASTVSYLSAISGILSFSRYAAIFPCMDSARQETHIDEVQGWNAAVPSPLSRQLTGKGVVFGILETEFDTHHPAFLDSLGRTRFAAIWDETDTTKPSNVRATYGGYGQIRKGSALNDDSLFATNGFYHGTIVTSFGAGSDRAHPWWGAAPEAVIVGVKYGDADADIVNGLKWIFAMSDSMKMPCVVNMSIGTQLGPHDGTSAVDRTVDALSGVGTSGLAHIVVGAAGNDAEHKCHVSFPLKPGETRGTWIMPNATGNPTMALNVVTFVDVWGGVNKSFTDTVYVYDTSVSPMQYKKTSTIRPNQAPDTTFWPNAATGKSDTLVFQIFSERNSVNQKQHIEMVAQGNNPSMIVGLRIAAVQAETVHVWNVEQVTFKSLGVAGFYDGDSLYTIAEVGGTSKTIITAGGYNSKVDLTTWNDTVYGKGDSSLHNYLSYSSLGPTADGRIKPDISAPARFVVGAMSRVGKDDNRTVLWPNPANTLGRYEFTGGTSVASPIVAGIVALMLEANHALTPANARQILQQTAINDAFTGNITTPDVRWGAGKVNALDAVKQLGIPVISIRPSKGASPCDEFNIVKTGRNRLLLKGPVDGKHQEARIELFDLSGRMLLGIHAKTGSAFSIPKAAELRFMIVRVRLPGGASFTKKLSVM